MQFAMILKQRRSQLGLTQQELATRLFVTRQTVSRWENNQSYPNLDTLIEVSDLLQLSLDELLKGDNSQVVNKISKDVRLKRRYQKYVVVLTIMFMLGLLFLGILGYGRATQNQLIDRFNPFLPTRYGYSVLPNRSQAKVDTFVSDTPFGDGEWLKFMTGQYNKQNKWVLVAHKGAYVSRIRLITYNRVPDSYREQVGTNYFKYQPKAMGPRTPQPLSWWPFS
ncbi:helix-turn-helix domain-containing protein [Lentilactobacillus kribbianus]|uniref:helix-turn-helix domain-containing protein n=1 Tax=Lentilactobacillus kribbianus TaxID=2729622 RepID=UPI00155615E1|nr:helix-turn-helix domain-containing protein [Lentilactobacillus kribbianus]